MGQLDALVDAQNDIFQDYIIEIRSSKQFFLDFIRSVGGDLKNILIAWDGDKIAGYVNPVIDRHEGWIGGIGIMKEYRVRGIGTGLMNAAHEQMRKKGVREVSLEVIEGNDRAKQLYERLGYRETRKFITAEGRPTKYQGFGVQPEQATLAEALALHEKSYRDACWQRRKPDTLVQAAKGAEVYKVDDGFVVLRSIDTNGFIPYLGVVPEKRRMGVGTSLAKFALSRLHDLGAFKVALFNVNEDAPTLRLLDGFGFKTTMRQFEMKLIIA